MLSSLVVLVGAAMCSAQECHPYWTGLQPKSAGSMIAFDDGNGPAVYVENFWGSTSYIDPVRRWDGHGYVPVGTGLHGDGVENSLRVLDDGGGNKLYCLLDPTGQGTRKMYRWPGSNSVWEEPPPGMFVHPAPMVGTNIIPQFSTSTAGIKGLYGFMFDFSVGMKQVTRWNGRDWDILGGTGAGNSVNRIAEFITPQGPNLVVSGGFFDFAWVKARYLVRWDGHQWYAMNAPGAAKAIVTWDDGTGPSLYIGWSGLSNFPPLSQQGIARWTGTQWVSVGGGLYQSASGTGGVWDMAVFDDGTGPALFVLGRFERAGGPGGIPALNIAKWDGQQWHALGAGIGGFPDHLAIADDGRGPSLFVEGSFSSCGGGKVSNIAQWVGCKGGRQCYADCDNDRILSGNDFMCFINRYAAKDPYANCDGSTAALSLTPADFQCYLNKFVAGCP